MPSTPRSLTALGTLFVVLRILDALSDRLIGYWWGSHTQDALRPQAVVIMGGVLITVSLFFVFRLPADAGIVHLTAWAMLFYLGYTRHEVPHMARGTRSTDRPAPPRYHPQAPGSPRNARRRRRKSA